MSEPLDELMDLAQRFYGLDIQYRREGTNWPGPWRVRIVVSKNDREDYRVTAHGPTLHAAVVAALIEAERPQE